MCGVIQPINFHSCDGFARLNICNCRRHICMDQTSTLSASLPTLTSHRNLTLAQPQNHIASTCSLMLTSNELTSTKFASAEATSPEGVTNPTMMARDPDDTLKYLSMLEPLGTPCDAHDYEVFPLSHQIHVHLHICTYIHQIYMRQKIVHTEHKSYTLTRTITPFIF